MTIMREMRINEQPYGFCIVSIGPLGMKSQMSLKGTLLEVIKDMWPEEVARLDKPPTPPKLQIREGAYYRRRDGNAVGPAILNKDKKSVSGYIWKVGPELYTSLGEYIEGCATSVDLVCEVTVTDVPPDAKGAA
jgi:hypothetical protein